MALGRISGGRSKGRENLNYGSGPPGRLPNRATATPQPSPDDPGYWFQGPLPQTPGGNIDWRAVNAPVNMPMADQQRSQADYRAERMVDKYNRIFSDPVALERAMNYSRANPRYGGLAGAQMYQDLGAEGFGNYVRDKFLNIKAGANARTNYMPGEGYNPQYTPYTPEVEAWLAQNPRENFMEGGSAWSAPTGPWRPPRPTQEQIDNAPRPRSNIGYSHGPGQPDYPPTGGGGPYPGDPGSSYGGAKAAFGGYPGSSYGGGQAAFGGGAAGPASARGDYQVGDPGFLQPRPSQFAPPAAAQALASQFGGYPGSSYGGGQAAFGGYPGSSYGGGAAGQFAPFAEGAMPIIESIAAAPMGGGQAAFGGGAAPFAAAQALGGGRASPGGAAPMGGLSSDIMRKLQMGMPPHLLGLPPGATAAAGRGLPGGATPTYPTGPVPRTPLPGTNPQPYPTPTPGAPHPGYGSPTPGAPNPGYGSPFQPGMYAGPMPTNWDIGMQAFGYRPLGGPMMGGYNPYGGSAFR